MSNDCPDGWSENILGQIARIRRGASPRPIDSPIWFADEGPGWIRIVDVTRSDGRLFETEQHLSSKGVEKSVSVHPGQLIMSICATLGEPVILEIEACIHDGFVVFDQHDDHIDSKFLYHLLKYRASEFKSKGQTGTQSNLNTSIIKTTSVMST